MPTTKLAVVFALMLLISGCKGVPLKIPATGIQPDETELGPVEGKATGIMLFQFIPIGQNSRFEAAYSHALAMLPGATRIVDIVIQENWFWGYILNGYTFHLRGTAVRAK